MAAARLGTKCGQVRSRQSQGPCAWWAALGSTAAAFPRGVGTLEVRSSRFQGGTPLLGAAREKKVSPLKIKIGHLGWQDLRTKEVAAKAGRKNGWKVSRQ